MLLVLRLPAAPHRAGPAVGRARSGRLARIREAELPLHHGRVALGITLARADGDSEQGIRVDLDLVPLAETLTNM